MTFGTQLASDNFTRANENPLSNGGAWAGVSSYTALQVVSDTATGINTGGSEGSMAYTGVAGPTGQYSSVTIGSAGTNQYCGATCYVNTATGLGYVGYIYGAGGTSYIAKLNGSGSISVIKTGPTGLTLNVGDVITLVVGSGTLSLYQNSTLLTSVSDATYTSGAFGIWCVENLATAGLFSNWSGGNLVAGGGNGNLGLLRLLGVN